MLTSIFGILRDSARARLHAVARRTGRIRPFRVYFGRCLSRVPEGALVLFPARNTLFGCGIAGIVAFKPSPPAEQPIALPDLQALADQVRRNGLASGRFDAEGFAENYLGGEACIESLWRRAQSLKRAHTFARLCSDGQLQSGIDRLAKALAEQAEAEGRQFDDVMGRLNAADVDKMALRIDRLRDIAWCLRAEILTNIAKVNELSGRGETPAAPEAAMVFRNLNAVLNSIDRMEVRGRDSAGISLLFGLAAAPYEQFASALAAGGLQNEWGRRCGKQPLLNESISVQRRNGTVAVAFTYKVAVEIGSLGDNIRCLRRCISADAVLMTLLRFPLQSHTVNAHTRWASVGAITEANCHPVDNQVVDAAAGESGIIHTCLNGDIDNFQELREAVERSGRRIHAEVTTDTKIIPLQIEHYLRQGFEVAEAFRRAVSDFRGSHAIAMHTDLAPGKLFLAHRGSGQAIFVGIAPDHYMSTSEVYGFIEETQTYIKLDGESVVEGRSGKTQGQIVILDQSGGGGLEGITSMYYDGTPCRLTERSLKQTALTSRDIDRQNYPHYFLKEISESPASVAKTLQNRWKIKDGDGRRVVALDERVVPERINAALADGSIRRIYSSARERPEWRPWPAPTFSTSTSTTRPSRFRPSRPPNSAGFSWAMPATADPWRTRWSSPSASPAPPPTPIARWTWCASAGRTRWRSSTAGTRTSLSKSTASCTPAAAGTSRCRSHPPRPFTPRSSPAPCWASTSRV